MSFLFGSKTTEQSIPKWLEDSVKGNLEKARLTGEIGYMPYYGPQVAALSPMEQSARQNTMGAMSAFGMAPAGAQYKSSLPEPMTMGGVSGYSSGNLYDQAVAELGRRDPAQMERYKRAMGLSSGTAPGTAPGAGQNPVQKDPRLDQSSPMYDPAYYNRVVASGQYQALGGGGGPQVSQNYYQNLEDRLYNENLAMGATPESARTLAQQQGFRIQSANNQPINDALTGLSNMGILGLITGGTPGNVRAPIESRSTQVGGGNSFSGAGMSQMNNSLSSDNTGGFYG